MPGKVSYHGSCTMRTEVSRPIKRTNIDPERILARICSGREVEHNGGDAGKALCPCQGAALIRSLSPAYLKGIRGRTHDVDHFHDDGLRADLCKRSGITGVVIESQRCALGHIVKSIE